MSVIHSERLVLEQENGPAVALIVSGDEFYARHETLDGYTVVYDDSLGLYCYAIVVDGRFQSSQIPIHKRPPVGIMRHVQESPSVRASKFEQRYRRLYPDERLVPGDGRVSYVFGQNNGLLEGRRVSTGDVLGLTIIVEFQDVRTGVSQNDVDSMLNGTNYKTNGNFCSVREYYHLMSNGKLNYRNRVVGPVRLKNNRKHYETISLQREALLAAIADYNLDLSQFDSQGQGVIDAISFVYAGRTVYGINGDTNNPSELWPHNSVLNFHHGGFHSNFYMISSLGRSPLELSIGTFCHESGHMLCRFPDLYDYGRRDSDFVDSAGLGRYCLMSSGNHLNYGRTPAPISAYLRDLVDWPDQIVYLDTPGEQRIHHGDYNKVYKYLTSHPNEYFMIENRTQLDLDEYLPSTGLGIFHCDIEGSNEYQQGTSDRHYQCALLQADGRRDLENDRRGDPDDLYGAQPGVALNNMTQPSSREWNGSDSGLIIRNISPPAGEIIFYVGPEAQPPEAGVVVAESSPDLFIPDNKPEGVSSDLSLVGFGAIQSISVSVTVLHSYEGDLRLELDSPQETNVLLQKASRLPGHDLIETYSSEDHPALQALIGEAFAGDWTIRIKDLAPQDSGRLNHWKIEVHYASDEKTLELQDDPEVAIPDNNPQGIESTVRTMKNGLVKDLELTLDISHSFIRDLRIELVAPSGHSVFIHDREGGGTDNIKRTYDRTVLPSLETLVDLSIRGTWTLRIKDLEGDDTGTLHSWSLKMRYTKA